MQWCGRRYYCDTTPLVGNDGGPYFNCRQCCYFGCPKKSKEVDPGSDEGGSKIEKKYKLEYRDGQEEQFSQEE